MESLDYSRTPLQSEEAAWNVLDNPSLEGTPLFQVLSSKVGSQKVRKLDFVALDQVHIERQEIKISKELSEFDQLPQI